MKASRYVKAFEVEVIYMKVRVVLTGLLAGKSGRCRAGGGGGKLGDNRRWTRTTG